MTPESVKTWRKKLRTDPPEPTWFTNRGEDSLFDVFATHLPVLCIAARLDVEAEWPQAETDPRLPLVLELLNLLRSTDDVTLRRVARVASDKAWLWAMAWLAWPGTSELPPWPAVLDPVVSGWLCAKAEGTGFADGSPDQWRDLGRFTPVLRWGTLSQFTASSEDPQDCFGVAATILTALRLEQGEIAPVWLVNATEDWPSDEVADLPSSLKSALSQAGVRAGDRVIPVSGSAEIAMHAQMLTSSRIHTQRLDTPIDYQEVLPPRGTCERAPEPLITLLLSRITEEGAAQPSTIVKVLEKEPDPTNLILYGPPGTGKTWSTTEQALRLCGIDLDRLKNDEVRQLWFEHLKRDVVGRIALVTFHPSFEYEDFIEGLVPLISKDQESEELGDPDGDRGPRPTLSYEQKAGVFKSMAMAARDAFNARAKDDWEEWDSIEIATPVANVANNQGQAAPAPTFEDLWTRLTDDIRGGKWNLVDVNGRKFRLGLYSRSREGLWLTPLKSDVEGNVTEAENRSQSASKADIKTLWRAIESGTLTRNSADWRVASFQTILEKNIYYRSHFVPLERMVAIASEYKGEEPRPIAGSVPIQQAGGTGTIDPARLAWRLTPVCPKQFVLVIDEINRGNISRIFGELLTLIEPSKRYGMPEQTTVALPGSKEPFSVPRNLHILGTMNTADRSIAIMDVALRRRFEFKELMPNAVLVESIVRKRSGSEDLARTCRVILESINQRIQLLYDREHQVGHSYFLGVRTWTDLRNTLVKQVIPLLQEYFFGAWDRVCLSLGCPWKIEKSAAVGVPGRSAGKFAIISAKVLNEKEILGFDHEDFQDQLIYEVNPDFLRAKDESSLRPFFEGILLGKFKSPATTAADGSTAAASSETPTNVES